MRKQREWLENYRPIKETHSQKRDDEDALPPEVYWKQQEPSAWFCFRPVVPELSDTGPYRYDQ